MWKKANLLRQLGAENSKPIVGVPAGAALHQPPRWPRRDAHPLEGAPERAHVQCVWSFCHHSPGKFWRFLYKTPKNGADISKRIVVEWAAAVLSLSGTRRA